MKNYKRSRDAAWQMLKNHHVSTLPVKLQKICKWERIRLLTYKEGEKVIHKLGIEGSMVGNDAFSFGSFIFYNDEMPLVRQRFSIAHELGHLVLHAPTGPTVYNREISPGDSPMEQEANVFASRLLAPLCVIHYLGVQSPEEIAQICAISITAARIRWERLQLVRQRDKEMRRRNGVGCFLLSPLEREVVRNFEEFIEKNRKG